MSPMIWYGKTWVTSGELRVTSESLKVRVDIQKSEFISKSYEFKSTSNEFVSTSYDFKFTTHEFKSTSSRISKPTKQVNQGNSLKISSFRKIFWQFVRQLLCSVSGDDLVYFFPTISWLWLHQKTKWFNINFERRDLTSAQKSNRSLDDFGETFGFNLIKPN